mmetsp:Transcript_15984/g.11259  ORF Transcript_15984/g.11259 Transcript_15984/m.11259 type:complete len:135 (+) Transcript_15984:54-458(+)
MEASKYSFEGQEVEVGIDEAGRGPVLGSMVYACAFWPVGSGKQMKEQFGFADSKQLTEEIREQIYNQMQENRYKQLGYISDDLTPEYLSSTMLAEYDGGGANLNKISHDSAIGLIKAVESKGFTVRNVYVDTVG